MASQDDPDMLDEYDFSGGVRGKYAQRYREGTNLVRLDDDVAAMFPTSEEVNAVLRTLGELIQRRERMSLTRRAGEQTQGGFVVGCVCVRERSNASVGVLPGELVGLAEWNDARRMAQPVMMGIAIALPILQVGSC